MHFSSAMTDSTHHLHHQTIIPSLPHATSLTYYAEGGANVIYKIGIPSTSTLAEVPPSEIDNYSAATPQPSEISPWEAALRDDAEDEDADENEWLKGKLLRVRKDVPGATSVLEAHADFETHIAPLFGPAEIVGQSLVEVHSELREQLTAVLAMMDERGYRDERRRDVYLAEQDYGLLVTDMRARPTSGIVMVEFKPKWLVQSPSAPVGARRCRNCALRAMREGSGEESGAFCPLELICGDGNRVGNAIRKLLQGRTYSETHGEGLVKSVTQYLLSTYSLLGKLKTLQAQLYSVGAFKADAQDMKFRTAMALRDCTLFLHIDTKGEAVVAARLGDLDLKSESKAEHWRSLERSLIDGGWYGESASFSGDSKCGLRG